MEAVQTRVAADGPDGMCSRRERDQARERCCPKSILLCRLVHLLALRGSMPTLRYSRKAACAAHDGRFELGAGLFAQGALTDCSELWPRDEHSARHHPQPQYLHPGKDLLRHIDRWQSQRAFRRDVRTLHVATWMRARHAMPLLSTHRLAHA